MGKWSSGTIYSNSIAVDGPPRPSVAATDGPPLSQVVPQRRPALFSISLANYSHYYKEPAEPASK